ncbi:helix-turn-helix domain-containing protein [Roseospira navarrensis]|uniref:Helix-turn-helix domain-containing protein n=1 Tax=Roseospira navarrensis TaxID=140058 RepID=A0A7X1ZF29_9PROT|nr:DNA-binding transcriptional regulator [Roseospira navarrensis]MQX36406.1 helix-turn-helix domain-containing protein [Roseospira navarrensis]
MTNTARSSILDAVHEAAQDLRRADLLDDITMREFDALCLPRVPAMTAEAIRDLRTRCRVSQPVFAAHLNVSKTAVASWEAGDKKPGPTALKLLDLVQRKGLDVLT